MSQVKQDLEKLLVEVDMGWGNHKKDIRTGIGGCLLNEMVRVTSSSKLFPCHHLHDQAFTASLLDLALVQGRLHAMVMALGFVTEYDTADGSAMFDWNDEQDSPEQIKARIRTAIERLPDDPQ